MYFVLCIKCIELRPRSRTMPRRGRALSSRGVAAAPRLASPGRQTPWWERWRPWRPAWCLHFFCTELHVFKVRWWIIEEVAACRIEIEGRWSLCDGKDLAANSSSLLSVSILCKFKPRLSPLMCWVLWLLPKRLHTGASNKSSFTGWSFITIKTTRWLSSDSSGSWWAATAATCCLSRISEYPKSQSTGGFYHSEWSPCTSRSAHEYVEYGSLKKCIDVAHQVPSKVPRSYYDPKPREGLILHTPIPHIILKLNCVIPEETEFRIYLSNMWRMAWPIN